MENYTTIKKDGYVLTNYRALCRRATLWIGQVCNQRCKFCYYAKILDDKTHPENGFMSLDKIKKICKTLVEKYNNNAVDIEGGEPTIYKDAIPMVKYCSQIGLKPTLITNALVLDNIEKLQKFKEAGVYDFLISVHALGEAYDNLVQVKGASKRQMKAIDNMIELGIPFRFNTVLSADVLNQLQDVAKLAVEKGARTVNFIAYNPFMDQQEGRTTKVPSYIDIMKNLTPAIDYLEENEIEVNLRYLPFCVVEERHRKNIQDFQQRIWDLHEWEAAGELWTNASEQRSIDEKISQPPEFFQSINTWRTKFIKNPYKSLIERLKGDKKITVALFGNAKTNLEVADAIKESGINVEISAFISSKRYVNTDTISGYLFRDEDWLKENQPDVVVVTSFAFRESIFAVLKEKGLDKISISSYPEDAEKTQYIRNFDYMDEFKPVEGFGDLEYAYREYRIFCAKGSAYYKGQECQECSLCPICDGFHSDYIQLKGKSEVKSIDLGKKINDPRYYMNEQLKVVEAEEACWALPEWKSIVAIS